MFWKLSTNRQFNTQDVWCSSLSQTHRFSKNLSRLSAGITARGILCFPMRRRRRLHNSLIQPLFSLQRLQNTCNYGEKTKHSLTDSVDSEFQWRIRFSNYRVGRNFQNFNCYLASQTLLFESIRQKDVLSNIINQLSYSFPIAAALLY